MKTMSSCRFGTGGKSGPITRLPDLTALQFQEGGGADFCNNSRGVQRDVPLVRAQQAAQRENHIRGQAGALGAVEQQQDRLRVVGEPVHVAVRAGLRNGELPGQGRVRRRLQGAAEDRRVQLRHQAHHAARTAEVQGPSHEGGQGAGQAGPPEHREVL